MKLKHFFLAAISILSINEKTIAHCQMPCGIYHDDLVYDLIDQYIETMYKAVAEIKEHNLEDSKNCNQTIRWVLEKEKESDAAAELITKYFLQQKIKPNEEDTVKKVTSAHKLLFLIVQIKQTVDKKMVFEFMDEWKKFKHMFHREGYECQIENIKMKKWKEEEQLLENKPSDDLKSEKPITRDQTIKKTQN